MPEKKYTLDWHWDMSYAVVAGTPSGWEVRCNRQRAAGSVSLRLKAYFQGRQYSQHVMGTGGIDDFDKFESVLNHYPQMIEKVINDGIAALQQHIDDAKKILGMTAA